MNNKMKYKISWSEKNRQLKWLFYKEVKYKMDVNSLVESLINLGYKKIKIEILDSFSKDG